MGIVTERHGVIMKKVGVKSREELKEILDAAFHLKLEVKTKRKDLCGSNCKN